MPSVRLRMSRARFIRLMPAGTSWVITKDPRNSPNVRGLFNARSFRRLTMQPTEIFLRLGDCARAVARGERHFNNRARNRSLTVTSQALAALVSADRFAGVKEKNENPLFRFWASRKAGRQDFRRFFTWAGRAASFLASKNGRRNKLS